MIGKIGVIYQDVYSYGFLEGLKRRLKCDAELVRPPIGVGTSKLLTPKRAEIASEYFKRAGGVEVIVRFTDADTGRWQQILRLELDVFPQDWQGRMICGVAVNNPEDWLAIDPQYIADELGLDSNSVRRDPERSDQIKAALGRRCGPGETIAAAVSKLVSDAPREVFKQWLQEDSFRHFYGECRRIAHLFDCETPSEL